MALTLEEMMTLLSDRTAPRCCFCRKKITGNNFVNDIGSYLCFDCIASVTKVMAEDILKEEEGQTQP